MNGIGRWLIMACGFAVLLAPGASHAQLAPQYASMVLKEAYYQNGDYKTLRRILKDDQKIADVPAIRLAEEGKPEKPRDLVLILDELAELHTYLDPHQEQVHSLNRRIRSLLASDLANVVPAYATRYSFLSQLPRAQATDAIDLNRTDLRLLAERADRRERYFLERLLAVRPDIAGTTLPDLMAVWNTLPANTSPRHRLALARRVADAAAITANTADTAPLAVNLAQVAAAVSLGLREKIEAGLLAAYFDTLRGNATRMVAGYQEISAMVLRETDMEQARRRERAEQFDVLQNQHRSYLDNRQAGVAALSLVMSIAIAAVAQSSGRFDTPEKIQNFGQSLGNAVGGINTATSIGSHQMTWQSSAIATELNRELSTLRVLHRYVAIPLILELIPPLIEAHAAQGKHGDVLAMADIYFNYANAIRGSTRDSGSREAFQTKMGRVFDMAAAAAFSLDKAEAVLELSERYSSHILLDAVVSGRTRLVGADTVALGNRGNIDALTNLTQLADAKPMTASQIIDYLGERDIVLSRLFEMKGKLGLLLAGKEGVRLVSAPVSAADISALRLSVHKLAQSETSGRKEMGAAINANPAGRLLASHLFADKRPLLLIPSTGLADFPFSALTSNGSSTPRYLIEQRPLIRHLSASIAKAIGSRNKKAKGGFVSLGDPALIKEYAKSDRLPAAERESREAAALMHGKSYVGEDATQEILLTALRNSEIVHIAAHGIFNKDQPLDSRLVIPSADRQSGGLSAFRLYGQGIQATTVLLSACSLGKGRITQSNEVNGFIRPLLMQSTRNVMSNLWEVDDDGAYAVTMAILKRVQAGQDIALAFHQGINEVIGDPRYASPYYWAPFVLFAAR